MIANAVFITTVCFLALGIFLLQDCPFLIPYRHVVLIQYGAALCIFGAALFLNIFATVYLVGRWLLLKDTGRKLAHLEKQLGSQTSPSEDLSKRLKD